MSKVVFVLNVSYLTGPIKKNKALIRVGHSFARFVFLVCNTAGRKSDISQVPEPKVDNTKICATNFNNESGIHSEFKLHGRQKRKNLNRSQQ